MSDFLDRVAARVIGGDTAMLTPRIPSIYEPTQATANAPLDQSSSVAAVAASLHGDDSVPPSRAASPETTNVHAPAVATRDEGIGQVRTQAATTAGEHASHASIIHTREVVTRSLEQRRVIEPLTHRIARQSMPETPSLAQATPPRSATRAAAVPDHAVGVLLPPEQPVFGASAVMPAKHAPAQERSRAAAVHGQGETHDPVVHVSIGRIEVRASAPSASTPRQKGGAPVDRLGDYLRERNKASP